MRISEKEGRELSKLPIGLIVEFKPKKKKRKKQKITKDTTIETIHSKASHYRVVNGEIVEIQYKEDEVK